MARKSSNRPSDSRRSGSPSSRSSRTRASARYSGTSRSSKDSFYSDRFASAAGIGGAQSASTLDQQAFTIPTRRGEISVTRRHLLYGIIGTGVLVGGGYGANAISRAFKKSENIDILTVSEKQVMKSIDCDEVDFNACATKVGSVTLDYGTQVFADDDSIAACLIPTNSASPLTKVGLLFYQSAYSNVVLDKAQGTEEGFEIYQARVNKNGLVWLEANILAGKWRIYTAPLNDTNIGTIVLAAEGGGEWETPSIAVCGSYAFWQEMPLATGSDSSKQSILRKVVFGSSDVKDVLKSTGRFSTPPHSSTYGLTVTPRTETDSVHYQLTLLNPDTDEVLDTMVLPSSMKPIEAGYGSTGFFFCFDAIYNYGGGIANLGTYTPRTKTTGSDYSTAQWFTFVRTPTAPPVWCGKYFVVKSTTAILGFDFDQQTYFVLDVPSGSSDYGTYLASTGERSTFVTYTNVDIVPIVDKPTHNCQVEVWTTK